MNGITERLAELVDDRRRDVELAPRIRIHLLANVSICAAFGHDLLLKHPYAVEKTFGARRTAWHVDIDRNDRVDPLHHRIVVEHPAGGSACAHGYAPLWL